MGYAGLPTPPCLPFLLGQGRVWFVSKVSLTHNISGVFGTSVISNHPVYTHCYLITMSHISIYSGSSLISLLLDSAGKDSGLSFQSVQSVPSNLFSSKQSMGQTCCPKKWMVQSNLVAPLVLCPVVAPMSQGDGGAPDGPLEGE